MIARIMERIGAYREDGHVSPGLYEYQRGEAGRQIRLHLRVDPDGSGLLLVNAAEAATLSPTGVLLAHGLLEGDSDETLVRRVRGVFRVSGPELAADLARIAELLSGAAPPAGGYPVVDLGGGSAERGRQLAAPYRADLVPGDPVRTRALLQRLWQAGIPHVTFLATPQNGLDLPTLVEAAGDIGMITGVRSLASWLTPEAIDLCVQAGLDHLSLLYVSADPAVHDELAGAGDHARVLAAFAQGEQLKLAVAAQVPLWASNLGEALEDTIIAVHRAGVHNLTFFALACPNDDQASQAAGALPARALPQVALTIEETSARVQTRFVWTPPVRFDPGRSLAAQVVAGPRTEGDVAVRVEADGSVLPARGSRECVGNVLSDTWERIWDHACFARYRERLAAPTRCGDCPDLVICATDCPKDPEGWSDDRRPEEEAS
ncbi:MAG TPA: hypothetical protein VGM19_12475 [Armatimonadota bacterium]